MEFAMTYGTDWFQNPIYASTLNPQPYYPCYQHNPSLQTHFNDPITPHQTTVHSNFSDYSMYPTNSYYFYPPTTPSYTSTNPSPWLPTESFKALSEKQCEHLGKMDEICKAIISRLDQMMARFDKQEQSQQSFTGTSRTQSNNEVRKDCDYVKIGLKMYSEVNDGCSGNIIDSYVLEMEEPMKGEPFCDSMTLGHKAHEMEFLCGWPMGIERRLVRDWIFGDFIWRRRKKKPIMGLDHDSVRNWVTISSIPGVRKNIRERELGFKLGINIGKTPKTNVYKSNECLIVFCLGDGNEPFVQESGFSLSINRLAIEPLVNGDCEGEKIVEQEELMRVCGSEFLVGNQLVLVQDSWHYHKFCSVNVEDNLLVKGIRANEPDSEVRIHLSGIPRNMVLIITPKPPWNLFSYAKAELNLVVASPTSIEEKETAQEDLVMWIKHQWVHVNVHVGASTLRGVAGCIHDMERTNGLIIEFCFKIYEFPGPKVTELRTLLIFRGVKKKSIWQLQMCTDHAHSSTEFRVLMRHTCLAAWIELVSVAIMERGLQHVHELTAGDINVVSLSRYLQESTSYNEYTSCLCLVFCTDMVIAISVPPLCVGISRLSGATKYCYLVYGNGKRSIWWLGDYRAGYPHSSIYTIDQIATIEFQIKVHTWVGSQFIRKRIAGNDQGYGQCELQVNRNYVCFSYHRAASLVIYRGGVSNISLKRNKVAAGKLESQSFGAHQSSFETTELLSFAFKSQYAIFDRGWIGSPTLDTMVY